MENLPLDQQLQNRIYNMLPLGKDEMCWVHSKMLQDSAEEMQKSIDKIDKLMNESKLVDDGYESKH